MPGFKKKKKKKNLFSIRSHILNPVPEMKPILKLNTCVCVCVYIYILGVGID